MGHNAFTGAGNAGSMRQSRRMVMLKIAAASMRNLVYHPPQNIARDLTHYGFIQGSSSPFAQGVYHPTEWGWKAVEKISQHWPDEAQTAVNSLLQSTNSSPPFGGQGLDQGLRAAQEAAIRAAAAQAYDSMQSARNTEGRW